MMHVMKQGWHWVLAGVLCFWPHSAWAAGVDGGSLSLWWGLPFAGTLLSIAFIPIFAPIFWHHHFGKVIAAWAVVWALPFTWVFGVEVMWVSVVHALVAEYVPFILLLLALFTVAGGIHVQTSWRATPLMNVGFLALGAVLASVMGTTGASMLLIRPLVNANRHRRSCMHVVIFFIFMVSNIGGALTPLGDPPLFLGFLKGVGFFWTAQHLWGQVCFLLLALLVLFYGLDCFLVSRESRGAAAELQSGGIGQDGPGKDDQVSFAILGKQNFGLLACIVGLVLLSGMWSSDKGVNVWGTWVGLPHLVRDAGLLAVVVASMCMTSSLVRKRNDFSWAPMAEVAKLFAGIFLTIIPVIAMLKAGLHGAFAPVVDAVTDGQGESVPAMYFWITGMLSSFLDNAPTYLAFFNTAGGDADMLMGPMAHTLMAISAGAVFMGALTYIGNAPNLMVKAIAEQQGVRMPGFLGYMVWSFGILIPLFIVLTWMSYL